ncbi:hypothetical protein [Capsulimonas corticalis]|uniref:hypothetical protein n=1 Tax=Capsulimonas corticalis TaxID=2219043 RepID=UPI00140382F9|nr:hypothetical protein [Capsulimonas corticalis]
MQVLTLGAFVTYHSLGTIVGIFYCLVVLGYLMDAAVWCARRVARLGKAKS